jgi:hypothetical protein
MFPPRELPCVGVREAGLGSDLPVNWSDIRIFLQEVGAIGACFPFQV